MVEVKLLAELLVPSSYITANFSGGLVRDGIAEERTHLETILMETFAHVAQQSIDTINSFKTIQAKLADISDIGTNHHLYREWDRIFREFKDVLRKSRIIASDISSRLRAFISDLMPFALPSASAIADEVKHQAIDKFVEACSKSQIEAQLTSDQYSRVIDDVKVFEEAVSTFAPNETSRIEELNREIAMTTVSLNKLKQEISHKSAGPVPVYLAALSLFRNSDSAFQWLQPVAAVDVRNKTWDDITRAKMDTLFYTLTSLIREVKNCQEHSDHVKATQEAVQSLKAMGLNLVQQKVQFFVIAWSAIASACVELKTSMDDAKNIGLASIPMAFRMQLDAIAATFNILTHGLDTYARDVPEVY